MQATEAPSNPANRGFGNEHASESLPGALPLGRNSPQRPAYGLYAEKFSGTAFTVPRAHNLRNWFYRIRPSVVQGNWREIDPGNWLSAPLAARTIPPTQMRWDPFPVADEKVDFVGGMHTVALNGDVRMQAGIAVHVYSASVSMVDRYFYNADGELLLVPQSGSLRVHTECGVLDVAPGQVLLLPRGLKFRVALLQANARGYVCENYGAPLRLPERGLVGSDGFANQRDFEAPVAAFEDHDRPGELVAKFAGSFHACDLGHSPLDVVAWYGNYPPYRYALERFNTIGSVSYDHPDPSIYTVLTSPSDTEGVANVDFVIFPPRWMVAEDTFRPPWFHRNVMSEFMGLIQGEYDAKPTGFVPGGASLHNCMSPHGPDADAFTGASAAKLEPHYLADTMAFMFESRYILAPTEFALNSPALQTCYLDCWQGLQRRFNGRP